MSTGLCRKCDCELALDDTEFIKVLDGQAIFKVNCSSCGVEYACLGDGEVFTPPYPIWTS